MQKIANGNPSTQRHRGSRFCFLSPCCPPDRMPTWLATTEPSRLSLPDRRVGTRCLDLEGECSGYGSRKPSRRFQTPRQRKSGAVKDVVQPYNPS